MARKRKFDEKKLSKSELRKLNALRKLLDKPIADKAFQEWLSKAQGQNAVDQNANRIAEALKPLIDRNELRIPQGGYLVRRGRGRVIVEQAKPQSKRARKPRLKVVA